MTTLLALGFPYSTSANAAAQDIVLQEPDLATEPDAVAVVSVTTRGPTTSRRPTPWARRGTASSGSSSSPP